ncbi:hypothetical protein [Acinetobacter bereziniae]|uniref:Uncharacterized protein n=2 Tax=Acinetobacter bereziniae TaxID=106648 RepID=N8YNT5_ACIBZ|nr:hypothetical protein [Acinetobacter bereziniae]ENV20925.1 hypothetical protein F963_03056 [Acinetobacter bereziniae NIPH 3]
MKKSLALLSGICLALSSGLASAVTLNGWNVGNPTPVGATGLVNATKNVGGVAKISNASIVPNASQVSKILRGGVAGVALTVAVNELLDGIDWVMDPANNQIKYKEKTDSISNSDEFYYYEKFDSDNEWKSNNYESILKSYTAHWNNGNYNGWGEITGNRGCNLQNNVVACDVIYKNYPNWVAPVYIQKIANPNYDPSKLNDKSLPFDTVSQKVIDNAQAGNTDAQVATVAAAQDILNEAQNDAEKAKPIVQQFEDNSTNADPNNPDPDDEKPVNDGKQSKKMNEKQIGELVGNKNWHNTPLKKKIVKTYSKELRGSNNFDFYKDPKTGEIFIKGNKSKEMILINLEKFL